MIIIIVVAIHFYYKGGFNILNDSCGALQRWQKHVRHAALSGWVYLFIYYCYYYYLNCANSLAISSRRTSHDPPMEPESVVINYDDEDLQREKVKLN
jgi:hypothetical protein